MSRSRVQLICADPSRAIQSQKDESDINTIVRNFGVTGRVPVGIRVPAYGDYDQVNDYRSAIEAVRAAEASFLKVPAEIRARFHNDPQAFAEFCLNRDNLPQLRDWGLASIPDTPAAEPKSSP